MEGYAPKDVVDSQGEKRAVKRLCAICGRAIGKKVLFGVKYNDGSMLCHSCMMAVVMGLEKLGFWIVRHERPVR